MSPNKIGLHPEQQEIIDRIVAVWRDAPTLRFLQLVGNCYSAGTDTYHRSDRHFVSRLILTYADHSIPTDLTSGHDTEREVDPLPDFEQEHGDQSRLPGD